MAEEIEKCGKPICVAPSVIVSRESPLGKVVMNAVNALTEVTKDQAKPALVGGGKKKNDKWEGVKVD